MRSSWSHRVQVGSRRRGADTSLVPSCLRDVRVSVGGVRALSYGVLALLLSGCFGDDADDEDRIAATEMPVLVLQPDDLSAEFVQFDVGPQGSADLVPGPREDASRFDRDGGYKARYRRAGDATTAGPLVVESRADVFASSDGAERDVGAYLEEYERMVREAAGATAEVIDAPTIGEETVAMTLHQDSGTNPVRYFAIAWRDHNVTASILVSGFEGKIDIDEASALAEKQQLRIAASTPPE